MKLNETMENQYIDLMIKLALDMQEQREVEAVEQDDGIPADPPVQQSAQRALSSAYERIDQDDRVNRNRKALHIVGRCVASVLKAAACIALIAAIAVPVAFASSPAFRSKVMELMLYFDHNQGTVTFSLQENPDASFEVPAEWQGTHFMSYIPEGLELTRINPLICYVEYTDSNNRVLSFGEYGEDTTFFQGTDGTTISCVEINGHVAYVIEGEGYGGIQSVSVTWTNQKIWFSISSYNMSKDETIKVALNVIPINPN